MRVRMTVVTSLAVGEGRGRSLTPEEEEEEGLEGLSLAQWRSVSVGLTVYIYSAILWFSTMCIHHICSVSFPLCIAVYIPLFRPQQIACTVYTIETI